MKRYTVVMVHDASTAVEVEANSFDEAAAVALEADESAPILCHICSRELELGDIVRVMVEDKSSGKEVEVDV